MRELGCYICDTDKIYRELTGKNSPFLNVLSRNFGQDIIDGEGNLSRSLLAHRAFKSKDSQEKLNKLTHPEILRISFERCRNALESGADAAVIDAPLLFESGGDKKCDVVISVICPEEIRLKRIMERDGITEERARERMSAQHGDEFYTDKSDYVVRSYSPYNICEELSDFQKKYLSGE
ncbi:MAG: dephospho-CoA kinase [Clostridiales bacterium]|nr:dephospho-CoA kinase [Clostridiales bacterium]